MDEAAAKDARDKAPELFFALVYPIGTNADLVIQVLSSALADVGYDPQLLYLIESYAGPPSQDVYRRYRTRMAAGTKLRRDFGRADAFALYCAAQIQKDRDKAFPDVPVDERIMNNRAFIIRSLKRPEELETLRAIYGDALTVIGAHSPRQARSDDLTWAISRSSTEAATPESRRWQAERLMSIDEREIGDKFGQRVSDTFPLADLFVDASDRDRLQRSVQRYVEILFGHPFHTPTRAEYGMFHAQGAALRSSDLSRQVGAAITTEDGEVIALGTNEVPKAGGGTYWEADESDKRDYTQGYDVNTEIKKRALRQVLDRLGGQDWLKQSPEELFDKAWDEVAGTDLMNVGEFGRGVHAEMSAIVDAARRGISVAGSTLYTTTFPCHVCARHIVSAGIKKVVYNEPYPKSLARFLHLDSIAIDDARETAGRTSFRPFVGLAPHLYVRLFRMQSGDSRKQADGRVAEWKRDEAKPRLSGAPATYIPKEVKALDDYTELTE